MSIAVRSRRFSSLARLILSVVSTVVFSAMVLVGCGDGDGDGGGGGDDGSYKTVTIGTQKWMARNLNINVPGSRCYNDSSSYCTEYGRLYTQEAARSACPTGWRLPTAKEWDILIEYVGGSSVAGKKLKSKSEDGTDDYGFSALLGGYGWSDDGFSGIWNAGRWWCVFVYYGDNPDGDVLYDESLSYKAMNLSDGMVVVTQNITSMFSVRCVQD